MPDLPRKTDEQIKQVREFLGVSTLSVLMNRDLAVSFRRIGETVTEANTVKANAMVQIAINKALKYDAPSFNKAKFIEAVNYILTLTKRSDNFYPLIQMHYSLVWAKALWTTVGGKNFPPFSICGVNE